MQVDFIEKNFVDVSQRDLMKFFSMLSADFRFKKAKKIFVNTTEKIEDLKNPMMVTIKINFQVSFNDKLCKLERFYFSTYRAINHCVSNSSFYSVA